MLVGVAAELTRLEQPVQVDQVLAVMGQIRCLAMQRLGQPTQVLEAVEQGVILLVATARLGLLSLHTQLRSGQQRQPDHLPSRFLAVIAATHLPATVPLHSEVAHGSFCKTG